MVSHDAFTLYGVPSWAMSIVGGLLVGLGLTAIVPAQVGALGGPEVSLILVAPFVLLLGLIALMPLVAGKWWHTYFADVSFFLGSVVVAYYLAGYGARGGGALVHAAAEYYSFIALVGGLYVVSGGILTEIRGRGGAWNNTLILAAGAVLANLVGTTGASVLLIGPFMRLNRGRLRALHVVFFIFIVSNCGGCLTPVGDPPLYLGFLKGVPFAWTAVNLWDSWLLTVGLLLGVFFAVDSWFGRGEKSAAGVDEVKAETGAVKSGPAISVRGWVGIVGLVLMIAGVFVDPVLKSVGLGSAWPVGATFQIVVAVSAYRLSDRKLYEANAFSFFPVKEVGFLFVGIFATMVPALGYLAEHGPAWNVQTPTQYYFLTGALSAVLDNAPTYVNFLQLAVGGEQLTAEVVRAKMVSGDGGRVLTAISTGAVFFGAMTYIGNGPNFMVRSIAEAGGVKMPSFFGYLGWACVILLPVLVVQWWVLVR